MIAWNQIKQDRRAGTRQDRGRAGQDRTGLGCAGQRRDTVLAGLARMSEPEHDNMTHVYRQ